MFRAWLPNCAWGIFLEHFKLEVVLAIFGAIAVWKTTFFLPESFDHLIDRCLLLLKMAWNSNWQACCLALRVNPRLELVSDFSNHFFLWFHDYFYNFATNTWIQLFICTKVQRVSLNIDKPELYETYSSQVKRSSFIKLDHNQWLDYLFSTKFSTAESVASLLFLNETSNNYLFKENHACRL